MRLMMAAAAKTHTTKSGPSHAPIPAINFTSPAPRPPTAYITNVRANPTASPARDSNGVVRAKRVRLWAKPARITVAVSQLGIRRLRKSVAAATPSKPNNGSAVNRCCAFTVMPVLAPVRERTYPLRPELRAPDAENLRRRVRDLVVHVIPHVRDLRPDQTDRRDGADHQQAAHQTPFQGLRP